MPGSALRTGSGAVSAASAEPSDAGEPAPVSVSIRYPRYLVVMSPTMVNAQDYLARSRTGPKHAELPSRR